MKYLKENKRYTSISSVDLDIDLDNQNHWTINYSEIDPYRERVKRIKFDKPRTEHSVCPHCHMFIPLSGRCDCQC